MSQNHENENHSSSLELLWNQAFQKVEEWIDQETIREECLLQAANQFADNLQGNKSDIKELTTQFSKELRQWEKTSREELLTATTPLMAVFPIKSYEEINNTIDQLWNKVTESVANPFDNHISGNFGDNVAAALEKYIEFRRNNRNLYVQNVKEIATIFQTNQLALLQTVTSQVKNVLFPLNIFMEQANALSKS
jgi:ribosomal protein S17E